MSFYTRAEIIGDLIELETGRLFDRQGNIVSEEDAQLLGERVALRFLGFLAEEKGL